MQLSMITHLLTASTHTLVVDVIKHGLISNLEETAVTTATTRNIYTPYKCNLQQCSTTKATVFAQQQKISVYFQQPCVVC